VRGEISYNTLCRGRVSDGLQSVLLIGAGILLRAILKYSCFRFMHSIIVMSYVMYCSLCSIILLSVELLVLDVISTINSMTCSVVLLR